MKLYTIGFTKKSAAEFFNLLKTNKIEQLVDIRLHPDGQLSGFAKKNDLPFFLTQLANGCQYLYVPLLAPTKEILEEYRAKKDWLLYEKRFEQLMDYLDIRRKLDLADFTTKLSCFLCSEASPEKCHRRLVAEKLASYWQDVEIIHL